VQLVQVVLDPNSNKKNVAQAIGEMKATGRTHIMWDFFGQSAPMICGW
jgi:hypothetical protein